MIDENQTEVLCFKGESETLDYKSDQYKFKGANNEDKSELLKDILSFANAWREDNAYILIGVSEVNKCGVITGISPLDVIDDADIQQFINSKTNKLIPFISYTVNCKKGIVQVIEIRECSTERPFFSVKDFGIVKKNVVKVRRGSSTDEAAPDEIARMTEAKLIKAQPMLEASISPAGAKDYHKEEITLRALNVDFENKATMIRNDDPVRNIIGIYANISSKDKKEWIKECFCICSVDLQLKNLSNVQAKDLRIDSTLSNESVGIKILDYFPSKPDIVPELTADAFQSIHSKTPCIHPQDTHYEERIIYFIPDGSGTADLTVKVFGENIKNPPEYKFKLNILVENRTLPLDCLKEESWNALEEDFIFNILNKPDDT